jgi:hypothetical protein
MTSTEAARDPTSAVWTITRPAVRVRSWSPSAAATAANPRLHGSAIIKPAAEQPNDDSVDVEAAELYDLRPAMPWGSIGSTPPAS